MHEPVFDKSLQEFVFENTTGHESSNFLGSEYYGAVISNYANAYSFLSKQKVILTDNRHPIVGEKSTGKFLEIKNLDTNETWTTVSLNTSDTPSSSQCHHGEKYTFITSHENGLLSETLYLVPQDTQFEVWRVRLTNKDALAMSLSLTAFVDYSNAQNSNFEIVGLRYNQFKRQNNNVLNVSYKSVTKKTSALNNLFFAFVPANYVPDVELKFKSRFENRFGYINPENNLHQQSGVIETKIVIAPQETVEFYVFMGINADAERIQQITTSYSNSQRINNELVKLKEIKTCKTNAIRIF